MEPVAENFLLSVSGSSCRERMLKPPLLVSAASESSERAAGARVGDIPKGRQATGKPSPETSYKAAITVQGLVSAVVCLVRSLTYTESRR